jgi:hypothetical protein
MYFNVTHHVLCYLKHTRLLSFVYDKAINAEVVNAINAENAIKQNTNDNAIKIANNSIIIADFADMN